MCLGPSLGPELVLQGARWGIPCLEGRRRRREKRRCCAMEEGREGGREEGRGGSCAAAPAFPVGCRCRGEWPG